MLACGVAQGKARARPGALGQGVLSQVAQPVGWLCVCACGPATWAGRKARSSGRELKSWAAGPSENPWVGLQACGETQAEAWFPVAQGWCGAPNPIPFFFSFFFQIP